MKYDLKEKMITLEQSKYEPPATISKAEIELEKSERTLNEKRKNYKIKVTRAAAKMSEEAAALSRARNKYELLSEVLDGFNIIAPEDGMVIDRKSTRLNSSHKPISYAVFCLKKKTPRISTVPKPRYHHPQPSSTTPATFSP